MLLVVVIIYFFGCCCLNRDKAWKGHEWTSQKTFNIQYTHTHKLNATEGVLIIIYDHFNVLLIAFQHWCHFINIQKSFLFHILCTFFYVFVTDKQYSYATSLTVHIFGVTVGCCWKDVSSKESSIIHVRYQFSPHFHPSKRRNIYFHLFP